jgi:hypothetical protein
MNEADRSLLFCLSGLVVDHSNRMGRILRQQGRARGPDGKIFVLAARFVLSFHSAKIASIPDFSKANP